VGFPLVCFRSAKSPKVQNGVLCFTCFQSIQIMVQFASLAITVSLIDFSCNLSLRLIYLAQAFIDRLQVLLIAHTHHLLKISFYLTKDTFSENIYRWTKVSKKSFHLSKDSFLEKLTV
jgi:hypothetical protein